MRYISTALMLLALTAFPAAAQDAPRWSGFYLGGHVGQASVDWNLAAPGTPDQDARDLVGGIQAGYNHQFANGVVLGVVADVSFGDVSDSVMDGNYIRQYSELDMFGSVRLRAGYALGRFLPYVTGGLAWQSGKTGESCPDGALFGHCSKTGAYAETEKLGTNGFVYGGGLEMAVTDHISLGAEYLRYDFDSRVYTLGANASARSIDQAFEVVRATLNYRF